MSTPLISIIIPTYNRQKLLERAVSSVLAQTYPHWQLIIINDGSTDETKAWCERLTDARILYLEKQNGGRPSLARNHALSSVQGEWVAFLDSDDVWYADKLQEQVNIIKQRGNLGLISTAVSASQTSRKLFHMLLSPLPAYHALLLSNFITTSTVLLKTELWKKHQGFNPELTLAEDYDLWLKVAAEKEIFHLNKVLVDYSFSPDALTKNRVSTQAAFQQVGRLSMQQNKVNFLFKSLIYLNYLVRKIRN